MKIEMKILNKEFYSYMSANGIGNKGKHDLPCYATPGSAGIDLVCTEDVTIYPGETKMIPTGLAIWIGSAPRMGMVNGINTAELLNVAGLILPRSGLGTKGLILANTVGLIDGDYLGELKVAAWNRNKNKICDCNNLSCRDTELNQIELKAGDRFAQLVFMPVIKAQFEIVEEFSNETQRGTGGFGHTG